MSTNISNKLLVEDEGIIVSANNILNFTGPGVSVTNIGGVATVVIPGVGPSTGLTYKGQWDASTNTPTLSSGIGTPGDYYIVSVAGTTNLDGITDWQVTDWVIFDTTVWFKIDNHDIQCYNTIKDESTILPQRSIIKFTGTGVTATDDSGETVINIPGNIPDTNYGLFSQTSDSTIITASIAETSLLGTGVGNLTIPANTLFTGDSFKAVLGGVISSKNNDTLRIKIKFGSVIIADSGVQSMPNITNSIWRLTLDFNIRTLGIPGVASISTLSTFNSTRTSGTLPLQFSWLNINNTTFDTSIDNTFEITAQWSSTSGLNSIQYSH